MDAVLILPTEYKATLILLKILGKECLSRRQQLPTIFNLPLEALSMKMIINNTDFLSVNQTGSRLHIVSLLSCIPALLLNSQ